MMADCAKPPPSTQLFRGMIRTRLAGLCGVSAVCERLLQSAVDEAKRSRDEKSLLADEAVQAAREGVTSAATRPAGSTEADVCLAAEQVLVLVNLLNLQQVGRSDEAMRGA